MATRPDIPVASFVGRPPVLDRIERVLLVRLRSIGDTVLMTPCISALKRWRPDVDVDVALEPFCAPVLESHPDVRRVVKVGRSTTARLRAVPELRRERYDLAVNLNGGSTASLLGLASGAPIRVGFSGYQFAGLSNCRVTSSSHVWMRSDVHTVEHQLALIAGIGIPVESAGPTSLRTPAAAVTAVGRRLDDAGLSGRPFAVFHVEASLETKRWPAAQFASLATRLLEHRGMRAIVVGQNAELVREASGSDGVPIPDLSLAETMGLIERAALFVGNDSGPAHIAAAFARPLVVVFGPSNIDLWRPWSSGPWRTVRAESAGQVSAASVDEAIESVLLEVPA